MQVRTYYNEVNNLFRRIQKTQSSPIYRAGIIAPCSLTQKGRIHLWDGGDHATHNLYNVFTPFCADSKLNDPTNEPGLAQYMQQALMKQRVRFGDTMILCDQTGANAHAVEAALQCHEQGICTIAIASAEQIAARDATHPTKKKLFDVCDITIDTCVPRGETLLDTAGVVIPGSPLATAYILGAITAEAIPYLK